MPIFKGTTSRGSHVRALHAALFEILSLRSGQPPRPGGDVSLRDHIAALERAYPAELQLNEVELSQLLEDPDDQTI